MIIHLTEVIDWIPDELTEETALELIERAFALLEDIRAVIHQFYQFILIVGAFAFAWFVLWKILFKNA